MNDPLVSAFIKLDNLSLDHRVKLTPIQAIKWLNRVNADPECWEWAFIQRANELVPPMNFGNGNPNTGVPHHWFEIGKEMSRVIYLKFVMSYVPRDFNTDYLDRELMRVASSLEPENAVRTDTGIRTLNIEADKIQEFGMYVFRFWID